MKLSHRFVKNIPDDIENGVIYISIEYATAIHRCCCGCGEEVVTPFSPTDWQLTFDGETISLYPSIGNWNFPCRSHYWITQNQVRKASTWTKSQVVRTRKHYELKRNLYYRKKKIDGLQKPD
jgi:hypothetical protein